MSQFNYKMIEVARNSRGISQKELAALLPKLNQPNISKIERGELPVSEESISNIAKALGFPDKFFYQEETKMPISYIYYRKRVTLSKQAQDKILADTHQIILRSIDHLLEEVELKEYPRYVFDITEGWTPQTAARRMREIMQIHPGKPVKDIVRLIEEQGVIVFFYDCQSDKFNGLTAYTNNGIPVIFVNKNISTERMKFTIVHELFHLVLHIPCNIEPWRDYERESDEATAEFFMPESECYKELQNVSYNKLGILKSYWGISKAAIVRRAKDLGGITEQTYQYLMIELGRRGERKKETGFVELDSPRILPTAINLLKNELGYTNEQLSSKAYLPLSDYGRFFDNQMSNQVSLRVVKKSA